MARRKQLGFAVLAAMPDRADGVDDMLRRELAGGRRFCVAGLTAAEVPALLENRRAAGAMNRAVHASAAEERRVRRVHDRVDLLLGDVALNEDDALR